MPSCDLPETLFFSPPSQWSAFLTLQYQNICKNGDAVAQLPMEVVGPPSLEVFQNCGDEALRVMVSGHGGMGLGSNHGGWNILN